MLFTDAIERVHRDTGIPLPSLAASIDKPCDYFDHLQQLNSTMKLDDCISVFEELSCQIIVRQGNSPFQFQMTARYPASEDSSILSPFRGFEFLVERSKYTTVRLSKAIGEHYTFIPVLLKQGKTPSMSSFLEIAKQCGYTVMAIRGNSLFELDNGGTYTPLGISLAEPTANSSQEHEPAKEAAIRSYLKKYAHKFDGLSPSSTSIEVIEVDDEISTRMEKRSTTDRSTLPATNASKPTKKKRMDERHEITDALRKLAGNRTDAEVPYHSSIEAMRLIGIINRDRPDNITDIE